MKKDGIIIINKSQNCTSHDVVYQVKKIFGKKVGHTGTLDPMATGVLPILIGEGTKLSKYLIDHDKTYIVKLQLGQKTDTADSEGQVIEEKEVLEEHLSKIKIEEILKSFIGKQEQIPPMYSAIKVNGKKLYEYARKGQRVEIEPRKIEIYDIELLNIDINQKQIEFKVDCSKGTYIRSLCEDIAEKLGTVGYMSGLQRTRVGEFKIERAITVEELKKILENPANEALLETNFITIEELFKDKESINLENKRKLELFLNGVNLTYKLKDDIYIIYYENKFIGIGIVKDELLKRDIVV